AGVVNLRGKIIPVIDLRMRFGMEKSVSETSRIIVFEVEDDVCSAIVDEVNEVIKIPNENIETATSMVSGINKDYIEGIAKIDDRLVVLVNLQLIALKNQANQNAI
ncbi:MAG: chemotaxis protein CheW, partial [Firmicutes bacterium]|nr:chemotaxis protein CheW [Bacillota bacterium]